MLLTLVACFPSPDITLTGVVWNGPEPVSRPLGGVDLQIVDRDGAEIGDARTDTNGEFELVIPSVGTVFAVLRKDGWVTTAIPGALTGEVEQRVAEHALYVTSADALADEEVRFADCAAGTRRSVGGEVRVYGLADPVTGESPTATRAKVTLTPEQGADASACYLDAAGEALDPDAFWTGDAGAFGIFDVEPGIHELEVRYEITGDLFEIQTYPVYVPDDEVARSPWYPAWVELPAP